MGINFSCHMTENMLSTAASTTSTKNCPVENEATTLIHLEARQLSDQAFYSGEGDIQVQTAIKVLICQCGWQPLVLLSPGR